MWYIKKKKNVLGRDYQTKIVCHHAMKKDVLHEEIMSCTKLHWLWMFDKCLLSQKLHSTRKSIRHIDCRFAILLFFAYNHQTYTCRIMSPVQMNMWIFCLKVCTPLSLAHILVSTNQCWTFNFVHCVSMYLLHQSKVMLHRNV